MALYTTQPNQFFSRLLANDYDSRALDSLRENLVERDLVWPRVAAVSSQGSRNRGGQGGGGALAPPTFVKGGLAPQYLSRIVVAIYTPKIHQKLQTMMGILMT